MRHAPPLNTPRFIQVYVPCLRLSFTCLRHQNLFSPSGTNQTKETCLPLFLVILYGGYPPFRLYLIEVISPTMTSLGHMYIAISQTGHIVILRHNVISVRRINWTRTQCECLLYHLTATVRILTAEMITMTAKKSERLIYSFPKRLLEDFSHCYH